MGHEEAASKPAARIDAEIVDSLEADLSRAIGHVTKAIGAATGEVTATKDDLDQIHARMNALVEAGKGAAAQTVALAASTEELAATSGEIDARDERGRRPLVDAVVDSAAAPMR